MNWNLHVTIGSLLALVLAAMAFYRKWLEDHSDHTIHLHDNSTDTRIVSSQQTLIKRVETVDRLTRILTILLIAYALVIAAIGAWVAWNAQTGL